MHWKLSNLLYRIATNDSDFAAIPGILILLCEINYFVQVTFQCPPLFSPQKRCNWLKPHFSSSCVWCGVTENSKYIF